MTIQPNMLVRLSFDEGARTVGLVTDYAPNREQDGQPVVIVDWTWDADREDVEPNVMHLPTSILTPVCAWVETFRDFDGSWESMPCRFDADVVFTWSEQREAFCPDHAHDAALDAARRDEPFTVERMTEADVVEPPC